MIFSKICIFSFCIFILLIVRLFYLLLNKKGNIQNVGIIAGLILTFSIAMYSIYNSSEALDQSERISDKALRQSNDQFIRQFYPYVSVKGCQIIVDEKAKMRNGVDKLCHYVISIHNSGNIVATDISTQINMSFVNKSGSIVKFSTHPTDESEIEIERKSTTIAVPTGEVTRGLVGNFWVNKEDADPIKQGGKTVNFDIFISYSCPEVDKKWGYQLKGEITGKVFIIKSEIPISNEAIEDYLGTKT